MTIDSSEVFAHIKGKIQGCKAILKWKDLPPDIIVKAKAQIQGHEEVLNYFNQEIEK